MGVYQGMYLLRMIEALEGDYPAVAHFLGSDAFADLVERYAEAHPSRSYTFNRFGEPFPRVHPRRERAPPPRRCWRISPDSSAR